MRALRRSSQLLTTALIVLAGCTSRAHPDPAALHEGARWITEASADAGLRLERSDWERSASEEHSARARVECDGGFPPFLCNGGCPEGQGCCITGIRPTGICQSLDACGYQCEIDCAMASMERSPREGLQCEAWCTWVAPKPQCKPVP